MRVLNVSPSYYPAIKYGGPIQSIHLLNKYLVKKGITVDVLTTTAGLSTEQKSVLKRKWNDVDGVKVKYVSYLGYEHYNFSFPFVYEFNKIIKNYDLVHISAVWNFPVLAASVVAKSKNKPYIISPKGVFHQQALHFSSYGFKKVYYQLFANRYLRGASAINYTSAIEKTESEQLISNSHSYIIPNGIDLGIIDRDFPKQSLKKFGLDESSKYILILGRINAIKGFDILLSAFSIIAEKQQELLLVISGNNYNPYAKELMKLIDEKGITHKVIFTGEVAGDIKWALYKNAFMFILPSYSENFGMSVVEAMASGCPVVISDKVGIYKDLVEYQAGIIVTTNVQSIITGIIKIYENEKLRKQISINALNMVKNKYDINKVSEQVIRMYERVVKEYERS